MALFGKSKQITSLEERIAYLEANASPEFQAVERMRAEAARLELAVSELENRKSYEQENTYRLQSERVTLEAQVNALRAEVVDLDDEVLMQEFGIYKPRYDYMSIEQYKAAIDRIKAKQKQIAKDMNEEAKETTWKVNGSATEGRKMVSDLTKLLLRAFNGDCDEIIRKVKFSNIEASIKAIDKSAQVITKLGKIVGVGIPQSLVDSKKEEAYLSFEFAKFKEAEKEKLRELKEQERERKKLEKEIEAERKKLEKEQQQYRKALDDILAKIKNAQPEDLEVLEAKKAELESNLDEVAKAVADVDYREANQKAGYVYIISNIGSFGDDVYKIGMTRRLDPMERVKELGDASVPFDFDVHALIFSDDAPGLEAALHHQFENRKLNLVNHRREFFKCSLDEIKAAVLANYDQTVEFVVTPDAEQFRISEKMRTGA